MRNAISCNIIYILLFIRTLLLSFTKSAQTIQNYQNCNDIIQKMEFENNEKCIQIILNFDNQLNCANLQSVNDKLYQIRSFASIKSRNVTNETYFQCEKFLIFSENYSIAIQILKNKTSALQFLPYSRIYFYLSENYNKRYPTKCNFRFYYRTHRYGVNSHGSFEK